MATLYTMAGDTTSVEPANGQYFIVNELYRLLDCDSVEIVPLWGGHLLVIDQKRALKEDLRINRLATQLFRLGRGDADIIVGPALICRVEEIQYAPFRG